jgi:hypothetical protein
VCIKEWAELADEYRDLELRHKEYREVRALCAAKGRGEYRVLRTERIVTIR